jgi:(S)-sulfolactate dehydrogenase
MSEPSRIVIGEFMDEGAIETLRADHDVFYDPQLAVDRDRLLQEVARARALIVRNVIQVDRSLLDAAPRLEAVGRLGVGLDNINVATCRDRQIAVCPANGANAVSVAEYVIAAILTLLRPLHQATAQTAAGLWGRQAFSWQEASGRRLGLVGFGQIGREVAKRAAALDLYVQAYDPSVDPRDPVWARFAVGCAESLEAVLRGSDILSLHVPLTPATRGLIGASEIALLPKGALLINAARGRIVDETALLAALQRGDLAGAAIDVFEEEPLGHGSVFAAPPPNLILTPHIAGLTQQSASRVAETVCRQIRQALRVPALVSGE